jgi:hypothetical protein
MLLLLLRLMQSRIASNVPSRTVRLVLGIRVLGVRKLVRVGLKAEGRLGGELKLLLLLLSVVVMLLL